MALTELIVKQARAQEKRYTLSDGKGLLLEIRPNGKKFWVIRYWVDGKEKRVFTGSHPEMSLREAREKNFELRKALNSGVSPEETKRATETFADVAQEFLKVRVLSVQSEKTVSMKQNRLERYILPALGRLPVKEITSASILSLCRTIEAGGALELTMRVKQLIGQIFNYAIATGRAEMNPALALQGALQKGKTQHRAAITEPAGVALLMRRIDAYPYPVVRYALKFSALVFCRPGEIRQAEWTEIDFEKAEWRIPAVKMKMKRPHIVPLATQTLALLKELKALTGQQQWLFPSERRDGRSMSENTVRIALRSMGYANEDMTPHGFRSTASTNLNEQGWHPDVIERQLAHVENNRVRAAYNYAEYLPERRKMMQAWADWLDSLNA